MPTETLRSTGRRGPALELGQGPRPDTRSRAQRYCTTASRHAPAAGAADDRDGLAVAPAASAVACAREPAGAGLGRRWRRGKLTQTACAAPAWTTSRRWIWWRHCRAAACSAGIAQTCGYETQQFPESRSRGGGARTARDINIISVPDCRQQPVARDVARDASRRRVALRAWTSPATRRPRRRRPLPPAMRSSARSQTRGAGGRKRRVLGGAGAPRRTHGVSLVTREHPFSKLTSCYLVRTCVGLIFELRMAYHVLLCLYWNVVGVGRPSGRLPER